jgi:hypothetical protein
MGLKFLSSLLIKQGAKQTSKRVPVSQRAGSPVLLLPANQLTGLPAHWLTGLPAYRLTGSLAYWQTGSPANWLSGKPAH